MFPVEQAAYLLHSRPYQEHKVLVEFLTQDEGKVAAVAYAGKTQKSNKKALLQPFIPLNISFKGKHQLKSLTLIEATSKSLVLNGQALYCGFYINELLVRLLPEAVPAPAIYESYSAALNALAGGHKLEPILRQFELALLDELGLSLDFSQVSQCASDFVAFDFEQGFYSVANEAQGYKKSLLLGLGDSHYDNPQVLLTAKQLMRQLINQLLGNKPLNSRKLFEK